MVSSPLVWLLAGYAASIVIGALLLGLQRRWPLLAVPNERSSHTAPTPTAGGLMLVLPAILGLVWVGGAIPIAWPLAAAGAALAFLGLLDDIRELSAAIRFVLQILLVAGFVIVGWDAQPWWWQLIAAFALLWALNLFNFMDGIDGLAGSQALVFFLAAALLVGAQPYWNMPWMWLMVGTVLAFLGYNWPKAKIFMGDTGSLYLGFSIAVIALESARQQVLPLSASLVLLAVFWFDASYTLVVRALTRQAFTQGHRSHLYQRIADSKGHLWTTTAYLGFAAFYLVPLAWLSTQGPMWSYAALLASILPLLVLAIWLRAGQRNA